MNLRHRLSFIHQTSLTIKVLQMLQPVELGIFGRAKDAHLIIWGALWLLSILVRVFALTFSGVVGQQVV